MRQTVRLDEVRAPRGPEDTLGRSAVLAADDASATLDEHYNAVLTQIRGLLGTATWRDEPPANVSGLSIAQAQAAKSVAAQVANIARHDQALADQARSINALSGQITDLLAIKAQLADLADTLSKTYATQAALQAVSGQVATLDRTVAAQIGQLQARLAQALSTLATQQDRISSIEAAQPSYVTTQGLKAFLATAYVVNAPLGGTRNTRNLTFKAAVPFVPNTLQVRYNGQDLLAGLDYVVVPASDKLPSDTIRLLHPEAAPHAQDVLTATYFPA